MPVLATMVCPDAQVMDAVSVERNLWMRLQDADEGSLKHSAQPNRLCSMLSAYHSNRTKSPVQAGSCACV